MAGGFTFLIFVSKYAFAFFRAAAASFYGFTFASARHVFAHWVACSSLSNIALSLT